MKPRKKHAQNFTKPQLPGIGGVRKKRKPWAKATWVAVGIDASMSSIAGAAFAYDATLKKMVGPSTAVIRWEKGTDYFQRLSDAAKAHTLVLDLYAGLKVLAGLSETYIAIEEPVAWGYFKRAESGWVKQQCQISGALEGGLLRYGFLNLQEIQAQQWQSLVAKELGITTHHTKWNLTKREGKFRAKEWISGKPEWNVPEFPDLINNNKRGLIPKPEESRAQPVQSDDRYEAIAIAEWMKREIKSGRA